MIRPISDEQGHENTFSQFPFFSKKNSFLSFLLGTGVSLIGKPLIAKMMPMSSRHDFRFFVDLACSVTDIQWLMSHGLHGGLISGKSLCSKVLTSMIYSEMRYDRILWDSTACNEPRREWWVWTGPLFTELTWLAQMLESQDAEGNLWERLWIMNYDLTFLISSLLFICARVSLWFRKRQHRRCVCVFEVLLY